MERDVTTMARFIGAVIRRLKPHLKEAPASVRMFVERIDEAVVEHTAIFDKEKRKHRDYELDCIDEAAWLIDHATPITRGKGARAEKATTAWYARRERFNELHSKVSRRVEESRAFETLVRRLR